MSQVHHYSGCPSCGGIVTHRADCAVREAQEAEQKRQDCRLGTELLEAIDNRDTVRIGQILRGEGT